MTDFPEIYLRRMRALLGAEFSAFERALHEPPALALRVNPLRAGAETLSEAFTDGRVPWCALGHYLIGGARPGLSPLHAAGAYYLQEASAMASAEVLSARPGERVLDLCAAPGGKSGQIASALCGRGVLVANEPVPSRAKMLLGNLERLGAANAIVTCEPPERLARAWPNAFDAVLVDAPCSGEGMFRRDEAARAEWSEASPAGCAKRQAAILDAAAEMVAPGGRIVYSTCTFSPEEDEDTVSAFLSRHSDFRARDFSLPGVGESQGGCLRLYPHRLRGDGHFAALLQREGASDALSPRPRASLPECEFVTAWPERLNELTLAYEGDRAIGVPVCAPDLRALRALRRGLPLWRVGKGYVEPEHALAMALSPGDAARTRNVDGEEARLALEGRELPCEGRGWTLIVHRGMPLGWGKASGGTLKNHIPKGLRTPSR